MNMRIQPAAGYPKLLRIEPETENKRNQFMHQPRPQGAAASVHMRAAEGTNLAGNNSTFPKAAFNASMPQRHEEGAVRYKYGYAQQSGYQPLRPDNTSNNSNIYLGGRTSSFGPAGCNATQKHYSFGSYSKGVSTSNIAPEDTSSTESN